MILTWEGIGSITPIIIVEILKKYGHCMKREGIGCNYILMIIVEILKGIIMVTRRICNN